MFAWEGAIAVAGPDEVGRIGSHRFMTCVPDLEIATASFLQFYFLTPEGLDHIRGASPEGAGRNKTLGLKALAAISVPTPSLALQREFDSLRESLRSLTEAPPVEALNALVASAVAEAFG